MIWGFFSAKGLGHIMVNSGSMNSEKYVATLNDKLLTSAEEFYPEGNWIFQDDGAPCHWSKKTKDWVAKNCPETLDWPGNSPDFSPIENLWGILKTKVRKHKLTTKESLISAIKKVWYEEISIDLCQKLAESLPKRISSCIQENGGHTKY